MREILFRGKLKNKGEWIYGDLLQYLGWGKVHIVQNRTGAGGQEIIPETVGQYTGLTDKNGKKIFEGDIVEVVGEEKEMLTKDQKRIIVKWQDEDCGFNLFCWVNYEVIGNIHDNPELLK